MDKRLLLRATVIFMGFIACWSLVAGLQNIWFGSDLTVPQGDIKLYESNGTTEIIIGTMKNNIWIWNDTTKSFNSTIVVENIGSSTCNIFISCGITAPWGFQFTGNLNSLAVAEKRSFDIAVFNPSAVATTPTGYFNVIVDVV